MQKLLLLCIIPIIILLCLSCNNSIPCNDIVFITINEQTIADYNSSMLTAEVWASLASNCLLQQASGMVILPILQPGNIYDKRWEDFIAISKKLPIIFSIGHSRQTTPLLSDDAFSEWRTFSTNTVPNYITYELIDAAYPDSRLKSAASALGAYIPVDLRYDATIPPRVYHRDVQLYSLPFAAVKACSKTYGNNTVFNYKLTNTFSIPQVSVQDIINNTTVISLSNKIAFIGYCAPDYVVYTHNRQGKRITHTELELQALAQLLYVLHH